MNVWIREGLWPEAHDDTDALDFLAASELHAARWLQSLAVLGLLLASIVLFALAHPS